MTAMSALNMTAIGLTRIIFNNTLILYVIHFYQIFVCLLVSLYLLKCSANSLKELQGKKLNGKKY